MSSAKANDKRMGSVPPDAREIMWAKRLEWPVLVAAAMVIPELIIEDHNPTGGLAVACTVANYVIWSAFALEVAIMLAVTTDRKRWCRTHWLDILITVATPPFVLEMLKPFQVMRLLRLLRLVRLAPLVRKAFSPGGLKTAGILTGLSVAAGAIVYNSLVHVSLGTGLLVSAFGLLSGNTGPTKIPDASSQIATIVLRIIGILVVMFFTGALAERFVRADIEEAAADEELAESAREDTLLNELAAIRGDIAQLKAQVAAYAEDAGQPTGTGH